MAVAGGRGEVGPVGFDLGRERNSGRLHASTRGWLSRPSEKPAGSESRDYQVEAGAVGPEAQGRSD